MKKFLTAFSTLLAGFSANAASHPSAATEPVVDSANVQTVRAPGSEKLSLKDDAGDIFNFVLRRADQTGVLMAEHESHASHASHSSHRSHYSSR